MEKSKEQLKSFKLFVKKFNNPRQTYNNKRNTTILYSV